MEDILSGIYPAYGEGRKAGFEGGVCPYAKDSHEASQWRAGWRSTESPRKRAIDRVFGGLSRVQEGYENNDWTPAELLYLSTPDGRKLLASIQQNNDPKEIERDEDYWEVTWAYCDDNDTTIDEFTDVDEILVAEQAILTRFIKGPERWTEDEKVAFAAFAHALK